MKKLLITIFIITFFSNCKSHLNNQMVKTEFSKKEQDSIIKIVDKLCGQWEINKKEKQIYYLKGIYFGTIQIECVIRMDNNELLNEINIYKPLTMSEVDVNIPKYIDSLYLPDAYSITVFKKGKYYGLKYHNQNINSFIPIKKLNDSILVMVDGRKFERKK